MKKEYLLVSGMGQCGCILTDLMKSVDDKYTTLYINSSIGDLKDLKYASNKNENIFLFNGADGSGRNRKKGYGYIINDKTRLASFMRKYSSFKYMLIFFSTGGGTGSGTIVEFVNIIKRLLPNMIINLVGVLPSLKEEKLQLKNTIECLCDLNKISNLVNEIKFINNNKGENYEQINKEAIETLNLEYSMNSHSKIGSIDEDNLEKITTCKGYGVALKLNSKTHNLKDAIKESKEHSVFSLPSVLDCVYGGINVEEAYDIESTRDLIKAEETLFTAFGNKNILSLGGCSFPVEDIREIEDALKEKELRSSNEKSRSFCFEPKFQDDKEEVIIEEKEENGVNFVDDDDIDKIFNPDYFR